MAERTARGNTGDISWPVKMAQYVPPPSTQALTSAGPFFKKRRCARLPGTWLASKTMATVSLSSASSSGFGPSIALILQGHVHEEHFLSNLAFTWPRFQDENGDTSSPGRVIFASYKNICIDEKHKFAMQFETVLQAEWFFKTLKQLIAEHGEVPKDIHNANKERMGVPVSQVVGHAGSLEISHEEMRCFVLLSAASHDCFSCLHRCHLPSENENLRSKVCRKCSTLCTDVLPLSELSVNVGVQDEQCHSTAFNRKSSPLVLPPRFPSLDLQSHPFRAHVNGCEQQKGGNPTITAEGLHNEQDLKEKIKAYFLDPAFQGFVERVERVWQAMEDEMATETSSIQS